MGIGLLGACSPVHPGEAGLLFGWDPVVGWAEPARAGCSVEIAIRSVDLYGELVETTESYAWDEAGLRQDASWEGGCRTRYEDRFATCDRHGFPVEEGHVRRSGEPGNAEITWKNTVRGGLLVRREGLRGSGTTLEQSFRWEEGLLVEVEEAGAVFSVTRRPDGLPLAFSGGPVEVAGLPAWVEGTYTYDAAGRLTERSFEGGYASDRYEYEGDARLPARGEEIYVGSSEADSYSDEKVFTWSCPPA